MDWRPVLYLDIDDTLLTYRSGYPVAAPGAREFLDWALGRFEVRWLTKWCPSGEMSEKLLADFGRMITVGAERVARIRGCSWDFSSTKIDGLAWLEHVVLARPFLWIEDEYGFGERERRFLAQHDLLASYRHCNVTEDLLALARLHRQLQQEFGEASRAAPPLGLTGDRARRSNAVRTGTDAGFFLERRLAEG